MRILHYFFKIANKGINHKHQISSEYHRLPFIQLTMLLFLLGSLGDLCSQSKLEIEGNLQLTSSTQLLAPKKRMIRWNDDVQDFEGYNGFGWVSLTGIRPNEETVIHPMPIDSSLHMGYAIDMDDNWLVAGAPYDNDDKGAVYIYKFDNGKWNLFQILRAPDATVNDGFGSAVAISQGRIIIGAHIVDSDGNANNGKVYFFHLEEGKWRFFDIVSGPTTFGIDFGKAVDIHGDYAIVGNPSGVGTIVGTGVAFIYQLQGALWSEVARVEEDNATLGAELGFSVAIGPGVAIAGAPKWGTTGMVNRGKIVIYKLEDDDWIFDEEIEDPEVQIGNNFGYDVSFHSKSLIVGAIGTIVNGHLLAGSAYFFYKSSSWQLASQLTMPQPQFASLFGNSVSVYNRDLIVGAYLSLNDDTTPQGKAFQFRLFSGDTEWSFIEEFKDSQCQEHGQFGWDVATNQRYQAIGMPTSSDQIGRDLKSGRVIIKPIN